jgi:hypothetical protein
MFKKGLTLGKIILVLIIALCLFLAVSAGIIRMYCASFRVFTERELIAKVEYRTGAPGQPEQLKVLLYPGTAQAQEHLIPFNGDEWVIESRMVQWKPFWSRCGVKRYYRLDRITSRYRDSDKEKNAPRVVYALMDAPDHLWGLIWKYQKLLPFVEAVYGNSAFVPAEAGSSYEVYITYSGLMIKNTTVPKKRNWWQVG